MGRLRYVLAGHFENALAACREYFGAHDREIAPAVNDRGAHFECRPLAGAHEPRRQVRKTHRWRHRGIRHARRESEEYAAVNVPDPVTEVRRYRDAETRFTVPGDRRAAPEAVDERMLGRRIALRALEGVEDLPLVVFERGEIERPRGRS